MRILHPRLWIAALSLAGVLAIVASDLTRTAPGPISGVHAREPELVGLGSCAHCHGGWFGEMTASCLECHAPIGEQLEQRKGLHGGLDAERAKLCGSCHSEHHGEEFVLVNRLSFAMAGVGDPLKFDHQTVGFAMAGTHLTLDCKQCHAHADVAQLPKGAKRFLGLQQDCGSCHEDAHEGRMQISCSQCHGQLAWNELTADGHDRHLPLTGGHAQLACRECHAADDAHSLEAIGERRVAGRARGCADCHESPHRPEFVSAVAALERVAPESSCKVCHASNHTQFRDERVFTTPEQHACSGFTLALPHDAVRCEQCHDPAREPFHARYPGRSADECRSCHEDAHRGEFDGKAFAANGCIDCHERTHFAPHAFTVQKHATTNFPLVASHAEVECSKCHERAHADQPATFHGTASRCEQCHEDAHRGYFDRFSRGLGANPAGTCAHCHAPTKFAELPQGGFDHGHWTGFALTGAHAQADCAACHEATLEPDELGRRFGSVARKHGEFKGCVTCHADPHQGEFDRLGLPRAVLGRTSCARCHVDSSFRAFPNGFDHAQWTGFPLQGAHQRTDCSSCHARLAEPDEHGRTWARTYGKHCSDCHQDPHGGQFDEGGPVDCRNCHRGAESFADLVFRHDVHSRFKLGDQHRNVACSSCHKPFRQGDRDVIRYRPLPTDCVACHGDAGRPFQRRGPGRR